MLGRSVRGPRRRGSRAQRFSVPRTKRTPRHASRTHHHRYQEPARTTNIPTTRVVRQTTEPGLRLYRSAQRMLQLEEQLLADVPGEEDAAIRGRLEIGASTGPAAIVLPHLLCEFQRQNPEVKVDLAVFDTQTVVSLVADRELELGIVGAARRHRSVSFEPFFTDEVILACPPGHPFAARTVSLDDLKDGPLVLMQPGAG